MLVIDTGSILSNKNSEYIIYCNLRVPTQKTVPMNNDFDSDTNISRMKLHPVHLFSCNRASFKFR